MDLVESITSYEDLQNWKDHLQNQSKEELIEFLMDNAIRNPKFCRELLSCFPSTNEDDVDKDLERYVRSIQEELDIKHPDGDHILYLSECLLKRAKNEKSLLTQSKIYTSVIKQLDQALHEGAGWIEHMEDLLVSFMDESLISMKAEMTVKLESMSVEEILEVRAQLTNALRRYNPFDGENRIREAIKHLTDLTIDRTHINAEGAYIRGAAYYANIGKK